MNFSRKKLYTPCWGYQFFLSWPPWISSQFYHDPRNFPLFCINPPGNRHFSLKFWHTPWNFPLISSTGGLRIFFWKSPILIDFYLFNIYKPQCSWTPEEARQCYLPYINLYWWRHYSQRKFPIDQILLFKRPSNVGVCGVGGDHIDKLFQSFG